MEVELNQPLDLSKVTNARAYCYKKRLICYYEQEQIKQKSATVYNTIFQPDYISTASLHNTGNVVVDKLSSDPSKMSTPNATDFNEEEDVGALNKTFDCNNQTQSFDEANHNEKSCNSSCNNADEEYETVSSTSNSGTPSPKLSSASSPDTRELHDSLVHGNKIRRHPGEDNLTPKQVEERRKKAARLALVRAKAIDQQRKERATRACNENIRSKKTIAALSVYANELNKLLHREPIDWIGKWKRRSFTKSKNKK